MDELAQRELDAGGLPAGESMDQNGMYERIFQDPNGHLWEVFYMDPELVPAG